VLNLGVIILAGGLSSRMGYPKALLPWTNGESLISHALRNALEHDAANQIIGIEWKPIGDESEVDMSDACKKIEKKLNQVKKEIYGNLTAWQRVQISRHLDRPYTLDYIKALAGDTFLELHGDRTVKDDKAMIGGFGKEFGLIIALTSAVFRGASDAVDGISYNVDPMWHG